MSNSPAPPSFKEIPILPLTLALSPTTKPQFLSSLRHALLNVGFLYLSETGLPETLVEDVKEECRKFFEELPVREKERIEMKNVASFLGWSRVSAILLLFLRPIMLKGDEMVGELGTRASQHEVS